jgi:glutamate synthase (NADPH/NADH) small chain
LNCAGHSVTVFERADRIGGLLRYGIPEFKMEKWVLDRRIRMLEEEGIIFKTNSEVGKNMPVEDLKRFDAVVLCGGAAQPRDLPIPGRDLNGIYFAMDFLTQQNKRCEGDDPEAQGIHPITAAGKHVIVIGGGDTGSDCIGTANRQSALSVTNFELFPQPSEGRPAHQPWPYWPMRLRSSSSHEEGCERQWSILTKEFIGENGQVKKLKTVNVEFVHSGNRQQMLEILGSEKEWKADLVLLALGFSGPETGLITQLGVELDARGNVKTAENYQTGVPGIFAAGDMRRGQSLIVWAIAEGREAARCVDEYLMGYSDLPSKGNQIELPRI